MADLVVDAGGRGSRAPRWLTEAGFAAPEETTIGVDFAYASAKFRIPGFNGDPERVLLVAGAPPNIASGALLEPIEGGLWHLSLAGRFGDYPPANEEGFLAFAKGFHTKRIYELISGAERVSEITQYRFPTSLQRHYERLGSFPNGFVVIGDAVCSFNPVYGQGISSAVLQAEALHDILTERAAGNTGINGLPSAFFAKASEVIAVPWTLAANFDFAFPQTKGERPPGLQEGLRYFLALDALQVEDVEVQRLLFEVFGLAKPLSALTDEPLRSRVLAKMQQS
jgi:flavin-dependent dehydrogenase